MNIDSENMREFLLRVLMWGGFGALSGLKGEALVKLAFGGPVAEKRE